MSVVKVQNTFTGNILEMSIQDAEKAAKAGLIVCLETVEIKEPKIIKDKAENKE